MSNGVKFCRGTLDSFQTLKVKDPNTLYFITNNREGKSYLYLGNDLIVGGDNTDLLPTGAKDGDVLTYDAKSQQWVSKSPTKYVTEDDLNDYILSWGEIKGE